ncbi:hypothetical protein [Thauera sp. 2A1]|uniref:hypothetical protein n=1 Tax=Thauera sp. 2A1 TaxID=2570191 RepID=UPI001292AF67|nr:hypothetical protein [Thauera sp. 2A1]KAI5914902.1 hypothetical protein GH664_10430 [Thauera sp. 2A1]
MPLSPIVVTDDNATPDFTEDDFKPTAVLDTNRKNIGDLDDDGLLDTTEIWRSRSTTTSTTTPQPSSTLRRTSSTASCAPVSGRKP